jgi:hypothetical protein
MNLKKTGTTACIALLLGAASCSDNNVRNTDAQNDTSTVDTRRYTDSSSNYITGDSAGINPPPASGGTGQGDQ